MGIARSTMADENSFREQFVLKEELGKYVMLLVWVGKLVRSLRHGSRLPAGHSQRIAVVISDYQVGVWLALHYPAQCCWTQVDKGF